MSVSLKAFLHKNAGLFGKPGATLYNYQQTLIQHGVLERKGRGPGAGVRAEPRTVAILLLAVLCASDRVDVGMDVPDFELLLRVTKFTGSDWPMIGKLSLGKTLEGFLGDPDAAVFVDAVELTRSARRASVFLRHPQTQEGVAVHFGRQGQTRDDPVVMVSRLRGATVAQLALKLASEESE